MKKLFSGIKYEVTSNRYLILNTLFFALSAFLYPTSAQTFDFLRQEASARQMALQGVSTSAEGFGFLQNPAFLHQKLSGLTEFSFLNHLGGLKAGSVFYAKDFPKLGTFVAGLRHFSYGDLAQTDASGAATGTFSPNQSAFSVGYAKTLKGIRLGANAHFARVSAGNYGANAVAFDAGAAYEIPKLRLNLQAALLNSGKSLNNLGTSEDLLPMDLRVGFAHRLDKMPLTLHVTGYDLNNIATADTTVSFSDNFLKHTNFGGEFRLGNNLRLRVGYNHRKHEALKTKSTLDLAGVGFGVGLKVSKFKLDWGMNNWSQNGKIHQLTVSSNF